MRVRGIVAPPALVLARPGCGGSSDDLPRAVEAFERRLVASRGVRHVDLLRIVHRAERFGRLRTIVQDDLLFEIAGQVPGNLDEFLAFRG